MLKYLQITKEVEEKGTGEITYVPEIISSDDVLYCAESDGQVVIYLKGANSHIKVEYKKDSGATATGGDLVKAINNALIAAAETTWTQAVSEVNLPPGLAVENLTVKSGV